MINIIEKSLCSGCSACAEACPAHCIKMTADNEGFLYPNTDITSCISCNKCENVCPVINPLSKSEFEPKSYAAYNSNESVRLNSSSGGIFTLLAESIILNHGIVFGAAFDKDFSVNHISADNVDVLEELRGSKYLQSRIGKTYKQAKEYLDNGQYVLFTGTPCQIEGLISFLGKQYKNLFTQDIICHGCPSPIVWDKYIEFRENNSLANTQKICFRNKDSGWKNYSILFDFSNRSSYKQTLGDDMFMTAFLQNLCLRPSCYECRFKKKNHLSDITLADFWGIQDIAPEMDDDKGTSLVIIQSEKGQQLWNEIKNKTVNKQVNFAESVRENPAFNQSAKLNKNRDRFMNDICSSNFEKCVKKNSKKKPFKYYIKKVIIAVLGKKMFYKLKKSIVRSTE